MIVGLDYGLKVETMEVGRRQEGERVKRRWVVGNSGLLGRTLGKDGWQTVCEQAGGPTQLITTEVSRAGINQGPRH